MKLASPIVVIFDQVTKEEFFHRLDWEFLVKAWSKTISWEKVSNATIKLELLGIDGLEYLYITRRYLFNKIFIAAYDNAQNLIQTGAWFWDDKLSVAVCYRRVYRLELVYLLRERLVDFCCNTFLKG